MDMLDILYSECLKLKRSKITTIGLLGTLIVPLLVLCNNVQSSLRYPDRPLSLFGLYDNAILFLMLLFAPLVMSVIASYLISREYSEKTLKTMFTVPISRTKFLYGKFLILFVAVLLFMFLSWLHILVLATLCSLFLDVAQITAISAAFFLIKMLFGGILLYMTITPILYVSIRSKGSIAPFVVAAAICLLNVVLSNSSIAGFFPWTASYQLTSGHRDNSGCPPLVSFFLIALLHILSIAASRRRFVREDIL